MKILLFELTGSIDCITLFNDSQSAQKLSVNLVLHKKIKHVDVSHFIRDATAENLVNVEYFQTVGMPADVLTKHLSSLKHYKFIQKLRVVNLK